MRERLPQSLMTRQWMVIYTRPRWEKKVDQLLQVQGIESYCPLRRVESVWADRKKMVDFPLFNSYVFVKINAKEELKVRQTLGVINFIYFQGKPAIVRDEVIQDIRHYVQLCPDIEMVNMRELSVGDRVRVKNGALTNQEGNVVEIQGKNILMALEHLGCMLVTKVSVNNIISA